MNEAIEMLKKIVKMQKDNYGNGMDTHLALTDLAKEATLVINKNDVLPVVIVNEAECEWKGDCDHDKCVIAICSDFEQKESEVVVCKYKAMHNYWKKSEDCRFCPECGTRL